MSDWSDWGTCSPQNACGAQGQSFRTRRHALVEKQKDVRLQQHVWLLIEWKAAGQSRFGGALVTLVAARYRRCYAPVTVGE
eukprot:2584504-Amphidinium_carterae.1